ncbi:MAG: hypothetical protein ACYTGS_19905, partial [Planctomycetota bacterium]
YNAIVELVADIARHLNLEPVLAGPPSQIYRLKKFIRKHRVKVISVATVVILLVSTAAVTYIWAYNQGKEADERIKEAREHEAILLSKAHQLYSIGQYQNALTVVETVLDSERVGPAARLLHARIIWVLKGPDRAEEEAKKLLQEKREIAGAAYAFLARIYLEKNPNDPKKKEEYEQIANDYQQEAERLSPTNAEAHFNRALSNTTIFVELEHWHIMPSDATTKCSEMWKS